MARKSLIEATVVAIASMVAACMLALIGTTKPVEAAVVLPSGFEDRLVAGVGSPTALAPMPDGSMLIASRSGQLRVYKEGTPGTTLALDISDRVCSNAERGLLGVAVDPNFSANHYVYLYYTFNKSAGTCPIFGPTTPFDPETYPVNRVSRFAMSGGTVDKSSEKILIDNIPSLGNHNAGDVHFGKDGYLYVSVGDGGCDYANDSGCYGQNDASRDTNVLLGKILRITRDGDIPSTNPYTGTDSARCNLTGRTDPGKHCQETFAQGLRNPFRFAFDPDSSGTRFFIGDVGEGAWEEVNQGTAGADYGWNLCEGAHDNPSRPGSVDCTAAPYTPPIHEYSHTDTGCSSITGQAFVPNDASWPTSYNDSYLFGDLVCKKIFELKPRSGGGFTISEFATGMAPTGPIAMAFGPYGTGQALYYTTAGEGEVHRIAYVGTANQAPTASVKTTSANYGPIPLTIDFDGSASSDPDGDTPLSYLWDFGDGSPAVETTTPTTSHTYTTAAAAGPYTAKLRVRDARGALSDPATVEVFPGESPPNATIESPASSKLFKVGEQIVLQGSASDPQDGQLADSALSWEVRRWHNGNHYHPFVSETGNSVTFSAPAPEDLHATGPGNYLEIRLTATDSKGLSETVTQELQPHRVDVTFGSRPSGLSLEINGETLTTPQTLVSWEDYQLNVNAPSPQTLGETTYVFRSWSDDGAQSHGLITGARSSAHTATFDDTAAPPIVKVLSPKPNSKTSDATPTIRAKIRDGSGELGTENIELFVDGEPRSFRYIAGNEDLLTSTLKLSEGRHTIRLFVTDRFDNKTEKSWGFRVVKRR